NLEETNEIVNLVCNLRDYMMKTEYTEVKSGDSVPSYFRCSLSLELMLDPVIAASVAIPFQTGNAFDKQMDDNSFRLSDDEHNGCRNGATEKFEQQSPYIHSRSESFSSTISSTDCLLPVSKDVSQISNQHPSARAFSISGSDELATASHVNTLIEDLRGQSNEVQTTAAEELRLLTKHNMENLGAIKPIIYVLKTGNDGAKENSAAALFSLSVIENNKAKIGQSARIVQAGAVKFLVQMMEHADGMVDKAVALLSNLSTISEGRHNSSSAIFGIMRIDNFGYFITLFSCISNLWYSYFSMFHCCHVEDFSAPFIAFFSFLHVTTYDAFIFLLLPDGFLIGYSHIQNGISLPLCLISPPNYFLFLCSTL
ncbi:hypothetical protein Lal_00047145, partial [Lupinus albus]